MFCLFNYLTIVFPFQLSNKIPSANTESVDKTNLQTIANDLSKKLENISNTVVRLETEMLKIKEDNQNFRETNGKSIESLEKVKRQLNESEELLEKYENILADMNNKIPTIPSSYYKEQNDWQVKFLQALDNQRSNVEQIMADVKDVAHKVTSLPKKEDIQSARNETLASLEKLKDSNQNAPANNGNNVDKVLEEIKKDSDAKHSELVKTINQMGDMTETLTVSFGKSYEELLKEIQTLGRVEQLMMQTADGVLDTKRRVEYGVHKIVLEVGELIKQHTKLINTTINDR